MRTEENRCENERERETNCGRGENVQTDLRQTKTEEKLQRMKRMKRSNLEEKTHLQDSTQSSSGVQRAEEEEVVWRVCESV